MNTEKPYHTHTIYKMGCDMNERIMRLSSKIRTPPSGDLILVFEA